MSGKERRTPLLSVLVVVLAFLLTPLTAAAQTRIKAPRNFFGIKSDVEAGREAARESEREARIVHDREVTYYVERIGQRLVAALPEEFRHPEFRYIFKVIDNKDINAFALPGGWVYVNRGMIEAARNEGELAGVMAHEISHVALRHGTAQVSKAYPWLIGLSIASAVMGNGKAAQIAELGGAVALQLYFLKFSRSYETQADILGSQIMARAGYDPTDLADVFRLIESREGNGGPGWLRSHPKPKDRYERINQEIALLRVNPYPVENNVELSRIQARLGRSRF
ncbi:MAG TPA: M48 family metallopeptidase [Pyrinomonadaceae bacterium]